MKENNPPISKNKLDLLIDEYQLNLPVDYYKFILDTNGGIVVKDIVFISSEDLFCVRAFYGFEIDDQWLDILSLVNEIRENNALNSCNYIPIAMDHCGNQFILNMKNGNVLFWDHEKHECFEETEELAKNISLFFRGLRKLSPDRKPVVTEEMRKNAKVIIRNPNLLKKYGKK